MHAYICFVREEPVRNQTLRERLWVDSPSWSTVSKLITATTDAELIKPLSEGASPRYRE